MTSKEKSIILTPLQKALKSLEKALSEEKNEYVRDAVIQRFEYTYELSWKFLRRYLVEATEKQEYSVKDIFRQAVKIGVLEEADPWFAFHAARNLTVHTYNEDTAEETYETAKRFSIEARKLLTILEERCGYTAG